MSSDLSNGLNGLANQPTVASIVVNGCVELLEADCQSNAARAAQALEVAHGSEWDVAVFPWITFVRVKGEDYHTRLTFFSGRQSGQNGGKVCYNYR